MKPCPQFWTNGGVAGLPPPRPRLRFWRSECCGARARQVCARTDLSGWSPIRQLLLKQYPAMDCETDRRRMECPSRDTTNATPQNRILSVRPAGLIPENAVALTELIDFRVVVWFSPDSPVYRNPYFLKRSTRPNRLHGLECPVYSLRRFPALRWTIPTRRLVLRMKLPRFKVDRSLRCRNI